MPRLILYFSITLFVAMWWLLAFGYFAPISKSFDKTTTVNPTKLNSIILNDLPPIDRQLIHNALSGNVSDMLKCITQWENEAQFLLKLGIRGVHLLMPSDYLQAIVLANFLNDTSVEQVRKFNKMYIARSIVDDLGVLCPVDNLEEPHFLPQTYSAASFLLAIAPAHEILAIPGGLRNLTQLYDSIDLHCISHDTEELYGDKLFMAKPTLAFIAPYSNPATIAALQQHKIHCYTLNYANTLEEIKHSLLKIGLASGHPLEAQLLALFMEAAFCFIDNRFCVLQQAWRSDNNLKALYLQEHHHHALPTTFSLPGQLMQRASLYFSALSCPISISIDQCYEPYAQEKIALSDPQCILLATYSNNNLQNNRPVNSLLQQSNAYRNDKIFYLEEAIQTSPTQYIVLAYLDIFNALNKACQ